MARHKGKAGELGELWIRFQMLFSESWIYLSWTPQTVEFDLLPIELAGIHLSPLSKDAQVAELVDAPDSKSGFFGSGGSIPPLGTILRSKHSLESQAVTSKSVRRISKSPTRFESRAWQASERVFSQYQIIGEERGAAHPFD